MPTTISDATLHEMVERIVRGFDPERIILFGSQARGDAHAGSDADLLVVMPDGTDRRAAMRAIQRAPSNQTVDQTIVVTTPDEIRRRGDLVGTVLRPALREGKVLYERTRTRNATMVAVR